MILRKKVFLTALAVLCALAAHADDLKEVNLALGTSTVNIGYPNVSLPLILGFWEEEGLDVQVLTTGGTLQGIQQLVAGGAQFSEGNAPAFLQGISVNNLPLKILTAYGITDWKIAVLPESPIEGPADLEGKQVGMISLATGGVPLLKSYLAANGLDPEAADVLPVGFGAAPVEALRSGQVDALLYWGSAVAAFENAGLEMRTFAPSEWATRPDYILSTTAEQLEANPGMAIGLARGMAKAFVFAQANPECAVRLHWEAYPDTRSNAPDEASALAADMNILQAKLRAASDTALLSDTWGKVDAEHWDGLQDYLIATAQISEAIPSDVYMGADDAFFAAVNDFDHDAIVTLAKDCKF